VQMVMGCAGSKLEMHPKGTSPQSPRARQQLSVGYLHADDLRALLPECMPDPVRELTLCYALDGEVAFTFPGDKLEVYFDCLVHGMALCFMTTY